MGSRLSFRRRGGVLAAATALLLVAAACDYPVGTRSAQLDPGFGAGTGAAVFGGLRVRTDDTLRSAIRMADGRIVALGTSNGAVVTRYQADGTLDPSFGDHGTARVTGLDPTVAPDDIALAPDGSILVPGRVGFTDVWGVERFLPDGTPDPAFGTDGVASVDVAGASGQNWALGVAATADRTYLLAWTHDGDTNLDSIVSALLPDGSLDPAFGPGGAGFVRLAPGGGDGKIAVGPDGNLIVAYALDDFSQPTVAGVVRVSPTTGDVLTRLDLATAGTPTPLRTVDGMAVGADGSIVLTMNDEFSNTTIYALRVTPALALDTSFGTNGAAALPGTVSGFATVALDSTRHRVLVARTSQASGDLVATALAADGTPDPGWGTGGTATLAPLATPSTAAAVFATPTGVLVAGDTRRTQSDPRDQYILALTPAGAPDPAFGDAGWVRTDIGDDALERFEAVAPLPGGGAFVAGDTDDGVFAGRYGADGTPDADHPPALVLPDRLRGPHPAVDAAVAPDGSAYVLVGEGANPLQELAGGGPFGWDVLKFDASGALDTSFGDGGVAASGTVADLPRALAVRPDGTVLVADVRVTQGRIVPPHGVVPATFTDRIVTLTPAGAVATATDLDTTTDTPTTTPVRALAVGPAGDAYAVVNGQVKRVAPDGTVSNWGALPSGVALVPGDLAVDGAGRVVVLGPATNDANSTVDNVARFDAALALDPTFANGGVAALQDPASPCCDVENVLAQADGTVTVVHQRATFPDETLFLTRLTPAGQGDPAFGSFGRAEGTLRIGGDPTFVVASGGAGPDLLLAGSTNAGAVVARVNG